MPFESIGSETRVNEFNSGDHRKPDMAQLANGDIIVVWSDATTAGDRNIMGRRLAADGTAIGGEFLITPNTDRDQYDPSITALENGGYAVSWTHESPPADLNGPTLYELVDIRGRRFAADGTPITDTGNGVFEHNVEWAELILDPNGSRTGGQFATSSKILPHPFAPDTDYLVLHESYTRYDRVDFFDGNSWSKESGIEYGDSLTMNEEEAPDIEFRTEEIVQAYDADYGPWTQGSPSEEVAVPAFTDPDAVSLNDGTVVIVYTRKNVNGTDQSEQIVVERWLMGNTQDGIRLVSLEEVTKLGDATTDDYHGKVAKLADGGYVVVWVQWQASGPVGVKGQIFNEDGTTRGGAFDISNGGTDHLNPSVAGLADGRFVVTWSANYTTGTDTNGTAIKGAVFTADGEQAAPNFTVNTTTANDQNSPDVLALADGNFIVSWASENGAGDALIKKQMFNPLEFQGDSGGATVLGGDFGDGIFAGGGDDTIEGRAGDDVLNGEAGNDTILGNKGADVIDGGTGADAMDGGAGSDTYFVDNAGDTVTENPDEGTDIVYSEIDYTLTDNVEILRSFLATGAQTLIGNGLGNTILGSLSFGDTLEGGEGQDTLDGSGGNDTLRGQQGKDTLDGGSGADAMHGGQSNDIYYVDNTGDTVHEQANEGTADHVYSLVNFTLSANVERLTLQSTGNTRGYGNGLDNIITGNSGANTLEGRDGNDTLKGGESNDVLRGGAGADALIGGNGNDTASYSNATAGVTVNLATGTASGGPAAGDTFSSIERIDGSNHADTLTGDGLANVLRGFDGADTILGGGGNDTIEGGDGDDSYLDGEAGNDVVNGGIGNDSLEGGTENDRLSGGDGRDGCDGGDGNDTLYGEAEKDTLNGDANNDTLDGGDDNDTLKGGGDNDRQIGGVGNDVHQGGTGLDVFVFTDDTEGNDRIDDWVAVDDQLEIDASAFGGGLAGGPLAANRLVVAAAPVANQAFGQFLYNTATGQLSWDIDGTGATAAVAITKLLNGGVPVGTLAVGDFDIVA